MSRCHLQALALHCAHPGLSVVLVSLAAVMGSPAFCLGQASISNTSIRPFVMGIVPVVGNSGFVGGVEINPAGTLKSLTLSERSRLQKQRREALAKTPGANLSADLIRRSPLRKVSLRGLEYAIYKLRQKNQPIPQEMLCLVGLQRVEYVFLDPTNKDVVLAGPAEGWAIGSRGQVVGRSNGAAVVLLEDLVVALQTAEDTLEEAISCSIDPTEEGVARFQRATRSGRLRPSKTTLARLEKALGQQRITVTGVSPETHFAHVLVAADFQMKRLAMNLEVSPVSGLSSYLALAKNSGGSAGISAPRWWMAPHYTSISKDPEGLAWKLNGQGVQVLTEDGFVDEASRQIVNAGKADPLAKKWAEQMTARFPQLAAKRPVFAQLRNCIDLALVGALLLKENVAFKIDHDFPLLMDAPRAAAARGPAPKSVASTASLTRRGRQWLVAVSGGVELDVWSELEEPKVDAGLVKPRAQALAARRTRWWWD